MAQMPDKEENQKDKEKKKQKVNEKIGLGNNSP